MSFTAANITPTQGWFDPLNPYNTFNSPGKSPNWPVWVKELFEHPIDKEFLCKCSHVPKSKIPQIEACHQLAVSYLESNPEIPVSIEDYQGYYLVPKFLSDAIANDSSVPYDTPIHHSGGNTPTSPIASPSNPYARIDHMRLGTRRAFIDPTTVNNILEQLEVNGCSPSSIEQFIAIFNERIIQRDALRQVALYMAEQFSLSVYAPSDKYPSVRPENFPSARRGLVNLFQCEDTIVLRTALERLIGIFQDDPITEDSYGWLTETISALAKMIKLERTKEFNVGTLRLLIQAYALSIMTLWLQSGRNASIVTKAFQDELWEEAEAFRQQLIPEDSSSTPSTTNQTELPSDPAVEFWITFAIQAAMRLKTEVSDQDQTLARLGHVGIAVLHLSGMIANIASRAAGGPSIGTEVSSENIGCVIDNLKKAFYHLANKKDWFEPMLAFQYTSQVVCYFPEFLDDLVKMAFQYKAKEKDRELFFGMIGSLESLLLHTSSPVVAEQCFKILMTNLFIDDEIVKKRIIHALLRIQDQGRECISTTAECLLTLIYETMTPLRPLIDVKCLTDVKNHMDALTHPERQLALHCMGLYIRRIINMQTESGMSQEPLVAQIARSQTGDIDGNGSDRILDVLRALDKTLSNPLTQDIDGNSILHYCVMRGNRSLIPNVMSAFGARVEVNSVNRDGKTALMLCVDPSLPPFMEVIPLLASLGCNPNIRDKNGHSFWHFLVSIASPDDVNYILNSLSWSKVPNLDLRDRTGQTPLMRCLSRPSPQSLAIAKILIQKGANLLLPNRENITALEMAIQTGHLPLIQSIPRSSLIKASRINTPLMMAAKAKKPEVLDYLLGLQLEREFSTSEILFLLRHALDHFGDSHVGNEMMFVIFKHHNTFTRFKEACAQAVPKFSWIVSDDQVQFLHDNEPISIDELKAAIAGLQCSPKAARLFGINEVMSMCFTSSCHTIKDLQFAIRRRPEALLERNILGRNCLQVSLLEGNPETKRLLLAYERQDFNNADYQGNSPLHYAAATLNVEAYARILERRGNHLKTNSLHQIPIVLALTLPAQMLPDPTSKYQPYVHLEGTEPTNSDPYTAHHHKFCEILHLTLRHEKALAVLSIDNSMETSSNHTTIANYRSDYGWNLLHYAAVYGHPLQAMEVAKRLPILLFQKHENDKGKTPLEHAIFHQKPEVALAMLEGWLEQAEFQGISKPMTQLSNSLNQLGVPLVSILAELGAVKLLKRLHDESESIDVKVSKKLPLLTSSVLSPVKLQTDSFISALQAIQTHISEPIEVAIRKGQIEVLELYSQTENGLQQLLDGTDEQGNTAVMIAARFRKDQCLGFLLKLAEEHGQLSHALELKNNFGQTALHVLCCTHRANAIDEIVERLGLSYHDAIQELDSQLNKCLKLFFDARANFCQIDEGGHNSVHLMSAYNHSAMITYLANLLQINYPTFEVRVLLQKLLGAINDDRRTPIFFSVANYSKEAFIVLRQLRNNYKLDLGENTRDIFGFTLLHIAAQEGHLAMCQTLVEECADIFQPDDMGETPIHKAALNRRLEVLTYLLSVSELASTPNPALFAPDLLGMTALHKAVLQPMLQRRNTRRQLEKILGTASGLGNTNAASLGVLKSTNKLLYSRGTIKSQALELAFIQTQSNTPIARANEVTHHSSHLRSPDTLDEHELDLISTVVEKLLDAGFDMNAQDSVSGLSVWDYLCRGPYARVMDRALRYVLSRNRCPNFGALRSHSGYTVAHTCALFGQIEQLKLLLPYLRRDINNKTFGDMPVARVPWLKSKQGFTPVAIALLAEHWDIAKLLIDAGCRLDRSTRLEDGSGPKGDNLLHLISSKPAPLCSEASALFDTISERCPSLLMQPNSEGQFVIETITANAHLSLIPLACVRMKNNREAQDAFQRARDIAQRLLTSSVYSSKSHSTRCHVPTPNLQAQALILKYSGLHRYLGAAWAGNWAFSQLIPDFKAPTIGELEDSARQYLTLVTSKDK